MLLDFLVSLASYGTFKFFLTVITNEGYVFSKRYVHLNVKTQTTRTPGYVQNKKMNESNSNFALYYSRARGNLLVSTEYTM